MKKLLVLLITLFITSNCFACSSFDECMNGHGSSHRVVRQTGNSETSGVFTESFSDETELLKAIAYKLDEISKYLDPDRKIKEIQQALDAMDRDREK